MGGQAAGVTFAFSVLGVSIGRACGCDGNGRHWGVLVCSAILWASDRGRLRGATSKRRHLLRNGVLHHSNSSEPFCRDAHRPRWSWACPRVEFGRLCFGACASFLLVFACFLGPCTCSSLHR